MNPYRLFKQISLGLFAAAFIALSFLVTVTAVKDILYYADTGTSFPPFAGAAMVSMVGAPLLLAILLLYCIAAKLYARHFPQGGGTRLYALSMRLSLIYMLAVALILLLGTFVSRQMGVHSASFVLLRLRYLCSAYSPLFFTTLAVFLYSRAMCKR